MPNYPAALSARPAYGRRLLYVRHRPAAASFLLFWFPLPCYHLFTAWGMALFHRSDRVNNRHWCYSNCSILSGHPSEYPFSLFHNGNNKPESSLNMLPCLSVSNHYPLANHESYDTFCASPWQWSDYTKVYVKRFVILTYKTNCYILICKKERG